jgi:hypothetical protein
MHLKSLTGTALIALFAATILAFSTITIKTWESKFVKTNNGSLQYLPDEKGNIIPDFSSVGYYSGDIPIPEIAVVKTIAPAADGNSEALIQNVIDEISKRQPDKNGFRGTILLKKGVYNIPGTIRINASGIVLRGEGNDENGTRVIATGKGQRTLIAVSGKGNIKEVAGSRVKITEEYVPVGATSFNVASAKEFKKGDSIIVFRPGTDAWIKDLKMDQIEERNGTKQWQAKEYNFQFERIITKVEGNKIFIDNPVVMAMESKYGGGEIYKYNFDGRIEKVGIENIYCSSEYASDTDEDHGWDAIKFDKIRNGWVRNVTSQYFGYSCVNLNNGARNISVLNSNCFDAKSQITGGRRYSFNNDGQMNLFMDCHATEGRHDFVTGAKVCGPNVFVNCTAKNTHADIGPHHRWAMGTLFDNIETDGEINIQDRGNWGSGHGWSGVNQVLWNCKAKSATVQAPWVSGNNYCIGLQGAKGGGRLKGRNDGIWEGQNKEGLQPSSLYAAQLKARQQKTK